MARTRTGAPSWAQFIKHACKLSHTPGFRSGATALLGADAADILAAWDTFCLLFEVFLGQDDWPLEIDFTSPSGPGDTVPA